MVISVICAGPNRRSTIPTTSPAEAITAYSNAKPVERPNLSAPAKVTRSYLMRVMCRTTGRGFIPPLEASTIPIIERTTFKINQTGKRTQPRNGMNISMILPAIQVRRCTKP